MVVGYRLKRADPPIRRWYARIYRLSNRIFFGVRVRDIDCACKLFKREALEPIRVESAGAFFTAELLIKLRFEGRRVGQVGVPHYATDGRFADRRQAERRLPGGAGFLAAAAPPLGRPNESDATGRADPGQTCRRLSRYSSAARAVAVAFLEVHVQGIDELAEDFELLVLPGLGLDTGSVQDLGRGEDPDARPNRQRQRVRRPGIDLVGLAGQLELERRVVGLLGEARRR